MANLGYSEKMLLKEQSNSGFSKNQSSSHLIAFNNYEPVCFWQPLTATFISVEMSSDSSCNFEIGTSPDNIFAVRKRNMYHNLSRF